MNCFFCIVNIVLPIQNSGEPKIKVKVKYDSTGSFTPYAFDTVQEALSGISVLDDDSFKVTVS